ncbi:NADPH-dependent diflavin oxidoreductase 1 [Macrosteles quadrilineatus]|uniref:NADPH-dependent diflavin oxidoreductase 1 n=1 Tax=Macrosteles quadrilineatus TaxID=74068 RepID=UPI0023E08F53|nr:NADPH-dependent diflavin oxidoreductase 1 [Macrosteles quadrilineatus]
MDSKRKLTILYGSQTGTAQEVAERIWREARCNHFVGPIRALDDYEIPQLIFENVVVFVCSTTGQGEQPDNMKKFWKFLLRKNLPPDSLGNLRFGVLGLGDSSYVKFNHVAKKLFRRLEGLGGRPLCKLGLADDQHDLGADAVVDPWISELWMTLNNLYPVPKNVTLGTNSFPLSRWHVEIDTSEGPTQDSSALLNWEDDTTVAEVLSNKRITHCEHFQDVRLVKLKSSLMYSPGDVVAVRPQNSPESVAQLLEMLADRGLSPEARLRVSPRDEDMPVPPPLQTRLTLRQCAQQYWDLSAVPKRYAFQLLRQFTTSELEKEKLEELSSSEGQEELYKYCNRPRRTLLEVLSDFPHAAANLPLPYCFDIFQPIRQRSFSIASSPKAHKGEMHILLAVVKYKTILVKPRLGLCSNWLASRSVSDCLFTSVRKGSFIFPQDKSIPLLMVGPGTGVAPFRSLVQERVAEGSADAQSLLLVFGNRNRAADYHMAEEWEALETQGKLTVLTAFSRDQAHKIYVQHVIERESCLVYNWLSRGCWTYVAGSANNMPSAVRAALVACVEKEAGLDTAQAEAFIADLENRGMYQMETWS